MRCLFPLIPNPLTGHHQAGWTQIRRADPDGMIDWHRRSAGEWKGQPLADPQLSSRTISIAPQGHSAAQIPQPLQ